jgi:hypothetical protein
MIGIDVSRAAKSNLLPNICERRFEIRSVRSCLLIVGLTFDGERSIGKLGLRLQVDVP